MVAQRSPGEYEHDDQDGLPHPEPSDWLTLQQAACELGVSVTTARRLLRKGLLRNRIVPRRGGFAYLVYLPGSRHAALEGAPCRQPLGAEHAPVSMQDYAAKKGLPAEPSAGDRVVELEEQVESLSKALSRALRAQKSKELPVGKGEPTGSDDPYAHYRWLARKKRWFAMPRLITRTSYASVDRLRRIVAGDDGQQ